MCEEMEEEGVQRRFLRERKKSITCEVEKVNREYEGIVSYLNELKEQVYFSMVLSSSLHSLLI